MHPRFLSNTYLVAAGAGGDGFLVDAGGPMRPLIDAAERHGVTPTHALLTHHHHDHVAELEALVARWPELEVLIHPLEREHVPGATRTLEPDSRLAVGDLDVHALATPGHTAGMLSFLITERAQDARAGEVFTGDTLFRRSVGGVRAPGHTTYDDLLSRATEVIHLDHVQSTSDAHMDASLRMIDGADELIAVWDGQPARGYGGTADVVAAAQEQDLPVTVIWPQGAERD